ncbi:hypothetical protein BDN72DRAFT_898087 [Pluteus cervinus]|uniref:Uncharacterized protein n=1 Tax=Pluteus cervinus TaxID=181527 RepID=A0ACD3ARL1_9AGAR|nr:hypothetical protein BDN72DRAFT_898087 [Pluteus cervinus]
MPAKSSTQKPGHPGQKPRGAASHTTAKKKQPLTVPERLKRLFTSLCAQIDGGHFTNAIKTCDKILRLEPSDVDARKTKLFLLLQTEDYAAALALIDGDQSLYAFERAYSLYRLHHETEAKDILALIKAEKGDDRGVVHLEAQMSYRFGAYQDALDLYNDLLDTAEPHTEEHSDIITNLQATQQHLDFINNDYLRAIDSLPSSFTANIESLPPPIVPAVAINTGASFVTASANKTKETPSNPPVKKVRTRRVPAGVVPGVTPPPDPERWLKKSERSTFNQGKRRKGFGGGGATQGSAAVDVPLTSSGGGAPHSAKSSGGKSKKKK